MNFAREWTVFGGASLALMGAALAAGARRYSEDNLAWQRQWRQAAGLPPAEETDARASVRIYRAAGALIFLIGLGFALSAATGFAASAPRLSPLGVKILGACAAGVGLAVGAAKFYVGLHRGPRFLEEDAPAAPLDERLSGLAQWALCALWAAFGLRLLWETPR